MQFHQFLLRANKKSSDTPKSFSHFRQKSQSFLEKSFKLKFVQVENVDEIKSNEYKQRRLKYERELLHEKQGESEEQSSDFHQIKREEEMQSFKLELKNLLMKMKEREKLQYIESLVEQARDLCVRFGYFYFTCAMVVFKPANKIKLSLWIHPNLEESNLLHPIVKGTSDEKEKEFYQSLKYVLRELFPTISLGKDSSYKSISSRIFQLRSQLKQRSGYRESSWRMSSQKSFKGVSSSDMLESPNKKGSKKSQIVSRTQKPEHTLKLTSNSEIYTPKTKKSSSIMDKKISASQKKTFSEFSDSSHENSFLNSNNKLSTSFHDEVKNLFGNEDDNLTLYGQKSDLNCSRNMIIKEVREELEQIL